MNLDEFLARIRWIKESKEWEDLVPMAHVFFADGTDEVHVVIGFQTGPQGQAQVGEMMRHIQAKEGEVAEVYFVADARMRVYDDPEKALAHRPGDTERAWIAGARAEITECLSAMHFTPGRITQALQPYDATEQTWGEVHVEDNPQGGLPEAIVKGLGW